MKSTIFKSALLVVAIASVLLLVGLAIESEPSVSVAEAETKPTTTTTTEPRPQGVVGVRLDNGTFRPADMALDLRETWIAKWVNQDPREYILADQEDRFEVTLAPGDEFEFDDSTLEPQIYRVFASVGFQRIPGSIDSRPAQ